MTKMQLITACVVLIAAGLLISATSSYDADDNDGAVTGYVDDRQSELAGEVRNGLALDLSAQICDERPFAGIDLPAGTSNYMFTNESFYALLGALKCGQQLHQFRVN